MEKSILSYWDKSLALYSNKVIYQDESSALTFYDVYDISRRIGSYLAERVRPESPVAILSGRHIYTPCCFLGVVQAGCFYAPMDATMPKARLRQLLSVIKAECMLVDRENALLAEELGFSGDIYVFEDILHTPINEKKLVQAQMGLNVNTPLYVIFTSGSTGIPKGVITSHLSLMNYIDAVCQVLNITEHDVLGGQAPLDYIAAVRDIYIPLKTGASTVIIPKDQFAMPKALFETLNRYRVTTLCWSVAGLEIPAKLNAFRDCKLEYVKKVLFSGSVMPCKYLRRWQENLPETTFINQYGPTEATASCTYYVVPRIVEEDDVLPIGVPYMNYSILLLSEDNAAVPNGEIGEICVKGPGLALGYYGDAERTAVSFVQNPLNTNYRELIYKTGDLGRWNQDGNLEFHGRIDRQIKHMGHRIELGEIEETANKIPGVDSCCALYHKDKELLYLFYTGVEQNKEIILYFRNNMPGFMVPRRVVYLKELPALPNGKPDMKALQKQYMERGK